MALALNDDGLKAVIMAAIGEPYQGISTYDGPTSAPVGFTLPRSPQINPPVPPSKDTGEPSNDAQPPARLQPLPFSARGSLKAGLVRALTTKGPTT